MKRSRIPTPADYREHRHRWAGLIQDIHAAVASDDRESRDRVWDRSGQAMNSWTLPAAYPSGLIARMMAQTALTWSRQPDRAARDVVTPILMQCVGLCDELLASASAEPEAVPVAAPAADPASRRLPYADA